MILSHMQLDLSVELRTVELRSCVYRSEQSDWKAVKLTWGAPVSGLIVFSELAQLADQSTANSNHSTLSVLLRWVVEIASPLKKITQQTEITGEIRGLL